MPHSSDVDSDIALSVAVAVPFAIVMEIEVGVVVLLTADQGLGRTKQVRQALFAFMFHTSTPIGCMPDCGS